MVGGLVKDEQVYGFQQEFYHGQTGTLASGEELHFLLRGLASEHEGAQYVAYLQADVAPGHTVDGIEDGQFAVQHLCLVLRKVTYLHVVPHLHLALEGDFLHDALHHGGLALTVLAHEGHLLASANGEVHMVEDNVVVLLACLVADDGIVTASLRAGELEVQGRVVHLVHLHGYHLLQLAYALLHLYGLRCLIAEAVDEGLRVGNLLLLVLPGTELLLAPFGTEADVLVVLHPIVIDASATYLYGAVRHVVYEGAVVAHQHHGTRVGGQELLQPLYGLDVQVVGGLVEQQHIGVLQQYLCQFYAHAPTAGELAGGAVKVGLTEAKSLQGTLQASHVLASSHHLQALALVGETLAQLHVALAFIVVALGHLLLHAQNVRLYLVQMGKGLLGLLAHGTRIGQHHHLRQIPHGGTLGQGYGSRGGMLHSCYYLQHSALACSVLTHQGYAVPVVHHIGDVREERTGTELHRKLVN